MQTNSERWLLTVVQSKVKVSEVTDPSENGMVDLPERCLSSPDAHAGLYSAFCSSNFHHSPSVPRIRCLLTNIHARNAERPLRLSNPCAMSHLRSVQSNSAAKKNGGTGR